MMPPIFSTVDVSAVRTLLKTGSGELRFYSFGLAPDIPVKPYAVWRLVYGSPENYLEGRPDIDTVTTQIDVYASPSQGAAVARAVAAALSYAIEGAAYVTAWLPEDRDVDTKNYHAGFQADWWVNR